MNSKVHQTQWKSSLLIADALPLPLLDTGSGSRSDVASGAGDPSGEETSSTLPSAASAVEEGKPSIGAEMEWGWEVVVCSVEAVPIEENTKVLNRNNFNTSENGSEWMMQMFGVSEWDL